MEKSERLIGIAMIPLNHEVGPQPGKQTKFAECTADIAIFGGAAGGGKSFALLFENLRHIRNDKFSSVIFRRTIPQIMTPGGLWDQACRIYLPLGASPNQGMHSFQFNNGCRFRFAHLEHEKNIYDWQGSEVPFLGFDELTHFSWQQFFYMLSRNRSSVAGITPYVRATTNPDPDSWVAEFVSWWIDPNTGYSIPERDGVVRWFIRRNDEMIWADEKHDDLAKSVTFISATVEDNQILMKSDPGYVANLEAMSYVDRMRLRHGNWKVRATAGTMFRREWFEIIDALPADIEAVRYWDRAASEKESAAFTAGVKMHRDSKGVFYVSDVVRFQGRPLKVEESIKNTASFDAVSTTIGIEQDPGQAGISEAENYVRLLAGYVVKVVRAAQDKITRAKPFSAQCERGNVKILRAPWNQSYLSELESFPDGKLKDQVDASSGAFNLLTAGITGQFTKAMVEGNVKSIASGMKGRRDLW